MRSLTSFRFEIDRYGVVTLAVRFFVAFLLLMPLLSLIQVILTHEENKIAYVSVRYFLNSLWLVLAVGGFAAFLGIGAAVITTYFEFPYRKLLEVLLVLPLALPAFLVSYALVEFFDYAGPLQSFLRGFMGWPNSQAYFFPKFRSFGGAVFVLGFSLYPYVYIYARTGLRDISGTATDMARVLGLGPWARFFRVILPMLRPSFMVGVILVMLETLGEYGAVDHFGLETLSTGIFATWRGTDNMPAAARLALVLTLVSIILIFMESRARSQTYYLSARTTHRARNRLIVPPRMGVLLWSLGFVPVFFGFILPIGVFISLLDLSKNVETELYALAQSTFFGVAAALIVMTLALFANFARSGYSRTHFDTIALIGYAMPGAVLGVGFLFVLAKFDHFLADMWLRVTGVEVGLLLTGSLIALVVAYVIRFYALGHGALIQSYARIPPRLDETCRILGKSRLERFSTFEFPMIKRAAYSGALLVFVDVIKELPATLILRPFGVETLATRVHSAAALENLGQAALSALFIALIGTAPVLLLIRRQ